MRRFYLILLLTLVASCSGPSMEEPEPSHRVLVSITPYRFFAERLLEGSDIRVQTLVPPGADMHFFEPSARQILRAAESDVWFRIGEPFEIHIKRVLEEDSYHTEVVSIGPEHDHEHAHDHAHHHDEDLHLWLSPRRVKEQVTTMAEVLKQTYPDSSALIEKHLSKLVDELETLDVRLATILDYAKAKTILVSHPAYTYFCEDYGLEQLSIEQEGRDPTPQALTELMRIAREKGIRKVFVQPQHSSKGAVLVADAIGATIVELDPFAYNYFENMRQIAWKFAGY